ncbi:hypothetical protein ES703_53692 [subsurface metagenome]
MGSTRTPLRLLYMQAGSPSGVSRPVYKIVSPLLSRVYFQGKNRIVFLVLRYSQEEEALPQDPDCVSLLKEIVLLKIALGGYSTNTRFRQRYLFSFPSFASDNAGLWNL